MVRLHAPTGCKSSPVFVHHWKSASIGTIMVAFQAVVMKEMEEPCCSEEESPYTRMH